MAVTWQPRFANPQQDSRMPKDEWGVKRLCPHCSTRFYDLQHDPMTCPNCGATFSVESLSLAKGKVIRPEKVKPEPVDPEEDLPEIEADDDAIETDDDLDDEILEDEEDNVDLDEIADVATDEEEN
jgi:uncharacterized protein (TIGR02300 family)